MKRPTGRGFHAVLLLAVFVSTLSVAGSAKARTLSLGASRVSTYIGGTFGTTRLGDSAYGASSGTSTTLDKKVPWTTSADIGMAFSFSSVNFVLGGELLMPRALSSVEGKNASGGRLFLLDSTVQAYMPTATLELLFLRTPSSRFLVGAGGGYAFATLENKYEMTAAGTSQFGVSDHTESGRGQGTMLQVYLGGEWVFTDSASAVFTAGYRNLIIDHLEAPVATTSLTGAQASGAELKNSDGGYRTLDLGGAFAGLQFRFYF